MSDQPQAVEVISFRPYFDSVGKRIVDTKELDTSKYEYVSIPEFDIYNKPHQGVAINGQKLMRGVKYFMPPEYAKEVRERLAINEKADRRLLQDTPDVKAVNDQMRSGTAAGSSTFQRSFS